MDTKKEDTEVKTAPEAPAMPAAGEPGPGPSAVLLEPLHGPVDVAEDSMEGLQSAFQALSVEEVDTHPVKRKRESTYDFTGENVTLLKKYPKSNFLDSNSKFFGFSALKIGRVLTENISNTLIYPFFSKKWPPGGGGFTTFHQMWH